MDSEYRDNGLRNEEQAAEGLTFAMLDSAMPGLSEHQAQAFMRYYDMLMERNRYVNLTRITEPLEVAQKHFADSLLAAELIPQNARVIDVGTGAGFPGIPIGIMRPDIKLTLLDSLGKRVKFLEEVCAALGIEAAAVHARAEDGARNDSMRGHFDIALSRAVAPMNVLMELTVPFLKIGGASLMYKGSGARDEILESANAARELCCEVSSVDYDVPWGARTVVIARKIERTPARYPRKAGTAQKKPL